MDRDAAEAGPVVTPPAPELSTRDRVREWRARDPEATAAEIARGLGVSRWRVTELLRAIGLPTHTSRSRGGQAPPVSPFRDRAKARAAARKGGYAKANKWRQAMPPSAPFAGTILDAMDAAEMVGPSFDAWRTFLRAVYALPMDDTDLERFTRHTGRSTPPAAPVREAWLIVGRRGGKSQIGALVALYQAIRRDWRALFQRRETLILPVLAADKVQAQVVLEYLKGLLGLPTFAPWNGRTMREQVELRNGVTIRVQAASFRTVRGPTVLGAVLDEVAFWYSDERSANPDSEVLRALRPGLLTVPEGLIFGLSSPYAARGELYKAHERYMGVDDPRGIAWNADTLTMNPLADQQEIAQAFDDDPVAAASEYGQGGAVSFRSDVAAFVDAEAVRAVTIGDRRELAPVEGIRYVAFVDPSGGSGSDSFPLAIAHREADRLVLDLVRERRPRFSPDDVCREFAETVGPYGITYVTGDRYAGDWPRERFAAHGIGYEASERTKSDLYREMLPLVNAGRVELLDLPRLAAQLAGLERRVARSGKDSIDHAPGGHDDVANAVAGALVLAAEGPSSDPHNPDDDKPFEAFSPEGRAAEWEAGHRVKRHPSQQSKQRNYPTDLS